MPSPAARLIATAAALALLAGCGSVPVSAADWTPLSYSSADFDTAQRVCGSAAAQGSDVQNTQTMIGVLLIGILAGAGGGAQTQASAMTGAMEGAQSGMASGPGSAQILADCMRQHGWVRRWGR